MIEVWDQGGREAGEVGLVPQEQTLKGIGGGLIAYSWKERRL